jgi:hypothetical protein
MFLRFAYWFMNCAVMFSICLAQNKPPVARPAEIRFATGKTLTSPRLWFDGSSSCDEKDPRSFVQLLEVKMENGVQAGLSFSSLSSVDVTVPVKPVDPHDYAVALHAPNKPLLSGRAWSFGGVCAVLPTDEIAKLKDEFPAGFQYPDSQCIFEMKSDAFQSLKSFFVQPKESWACPYLRPSPPMKIQFGLSNVRLIVFK